MNAFDYFFENTCNLEKGFLEGKEEISYNELYRVSVSLSNYLKNTIGADFALPVSSWIFRGEAACNITDDYEQFMYIPNPDIAYVAAVEHNFVGITTISDLPYTAV